MDAFFYVEPTPCYPLSIKCNNETKIRWLHCAAAEKKSLLYAICPGFKKTLCYKRLGHWVLCSLLSNGYLYAVLIFTRRAKTFSTLTFKDERDVQFRVGNRLMHDGILHAKSDPEKISYCSSGNLYRSAFCASTLFGNIDIDWKQ